MTDQRLQALLRACEALDDPKLAPERIASLRQVCAVLADSFLVTIRATPHLLSDDEIPVNGWPQLDPGGAPLELANGYHLARTTLCYVDSLTWPTRTDRDIDTRRRTMHEWGEARRNAEQFVFGAVKESTEIALDRLEHCGAALVAGVAMKDTTAPPEARPTAWSFD